MNEYQMTASEKKFISQHMLVALAALALGTLFGPLQAFEHAGLDLYPFLKPLIKSYYQGLTLHGVLNALVWTTFFITGFLTFNTIYVLKRPLRYPKLNQAGFWLMVVGLVVAAVPILTNDASVLYTFYPPMKAHWAYYVGLTLVVVGSWLEGYGIFFTLAAWRKDNPEERTPFIPLASAITMALWQFATLGIAAEMLFMLIPWSLGLVDKVDPELARTLFWWTGHPLVYFWLLPAYISWYAMLPKQAGGKMFSEQLARLAFWLFLLFSTPVGFHHQYADPGVPAGWKYIHAVLTYLVAFPSFMTAFTVIASLEYGARKNGGKGLFGWVRALPWKDPSVNAQLLAGLIFFFGGIGGIANASYNVNLELHNTTFIPGHFHLTVATGVTLTFMGITYWLIPYLTGKKLWRPDLARWQAWLWFVGMIIFSNSMHVLGILGAPRRTPLGEAPYIPPEWNSRLLQVGLGGAILFISAILYFVVLGKTAWRKNAEPADVEVPVATSLDAHRPMPAWLDSWKNWLYGVVVLLILAYGPSIWELVSNMIGSPGFRVW